MRRVKRLKADDPAVKRRALQCREVRLYLATHPGKTSREIAEATGLKNARSLLDRMEAMGIVKLDEKECEETGREIWFVVPQ